MSHFSLFNRICSRVIFAVCFVKILTRTSRCWRCSPSLWDFRLFRYTLSHPWRGCLIEVFSIKVQSGTMDLQFTHTPHVYVHTRRNYIQRRYLRKDKKKDTATRSQQELLCYVPIAKHPPHNSRCRLSFPRRERLDMIW